MNISSWISEYLNPDNMFPFRFDLKNRGNPKNDCPRTSAIIMFKPNLTQFKLLAGVGHPGVAKILDNIPVKQLM